MAAVAGKNRNRAPSALLAKQRRFRSKRRRVAKDYAVKVEAKSRQRGGYGKAVVSCRDVPPGGMKKSPAWRKLIARCGGEEPPAPKDRAGAPLKGGFPLHKWPPNVLVDSQRTIWLPDDWGQCIKNTGPGGTYIIWVSPEGKFFYHKCGFPSAIEETIGRKLTALDGFNGIMRSVKSSMNADADKAFLRDVLTAGERRHMLSADKFHFAVVSARRALEGTYDVLVVEAHFRLAGVRPTWYVDAASFADYKKLGLDVVVGGKLTPARNMALDVAKKKGHVCVQVSDDISKWQYYDCERQDFRGQTGFAKANAALQGTRRHIISPLAAAQFILCKMRSSPSTPKLGGVFPTQNASMALGVEEFSTQNFILGDFFVADASPCRFDTTMTLKEDYDYTCAHIDRHGGVLRCNRLFVHAKHSTNKGGAVATRDGKGVKERANIAILQKKWPGVFRLNSKRTDEVIMDWRCRKRPKSNRSKSVYPATPSGGSRGNTAKVRKTSISMRS